MRSYYRGDNLFGIDFYPWSSPWEWPPIDFSADPEAGPHALRLISGGPGDDVMFTGVGGARGEIIGENATRVFYGPVPKVKGNGGDDIIVDGYFHRRGARAPDWGRPDDKLYGFGGNRDGATISGGAGDDLIIAGWDGDRVFAGPGNDVVMGDAVEVLDEGPASLLFVIRFRVSEPRYAGGDELYGGPGHDVINGMRGDDKVQGGSGDDLLHGGYGDDRMFGGRDNDGMWGRQGDDKMYGGPGDDYLAGGEGDDWVQGGPGDDELYGEAGDDILKGGAGDDELFPWGPGDDYLVGGPGQDLFDTRGAFQGETIYILDFERGSDSISSSGFSLYRRNATWESKLSPNATWEPHVLTAAEETAARRAHDEIEGEGIMITVPALNLYIDGAGHIDDLA